MKTPTRYLCPTARQSFQHGPLAGVFEAFTQQTERCQKWQRSKKPGADVQAIPVTTRLRTQTTIRSTINAPTTQQVVIWRSSCFIVSGAVWSCRHSPVRRIFSGSRVGAPIPGGRTGIAGIANRAHAMPVMTWLLCGPGTWWQARGQSAPAVIGLLIGSCTTACAGPAMRGIGNWPGVETVRARFRVNSQNAGNCIRFRCGWSGQARGPSSAPAACWRPF